MEIKKIATQLCNLPEGEYKVETNMGVIEVISTSTDDERHYNVSINIKIDGKNYMQINRVCDLFHEINYKSLSDNSTYFLIRDYNNEKNPRIECTVNNRRILVRESEVYDMSLGNKYIVSNGVIRNDYEVEEFPMTYNIKTNEKSIYFRKSHTKTYADSNSSKDYIKTSSNIMGVIKKYNKLVEMVNHSLLDSIKADEDFNSFQDELIQLAQSTQIPAIALDELKKGDEDITLMAQIYKKYAPLLGETHTKEMVETLGNVANILTKQYCSVSSSNQAKHNLSKKFNINDYKNN